MPTPGEHKTVQSRILAYAAAIGWTVVSREEAEQRRGFDPAAPAEERARNRSLFFDDLLDAKLRDFNPRYGEAKGALLGQLRHLPASIYGNRDFLELLRNRGKFFDHEEKRERDLILIDYDDSQRLPEQRRNVYEVTEEWAYHNGHHGTREDVVFLINGLPVLVIECKNADKTRPLPSALIRSAATTAKRPSCSSPSSCSAPPMLSAFAMAFLGTPCAATSLPGSTSRWATLRPRSTASAPSPSCSPSCSTSSSSPRKMKSSTSRAS
jgi:hypothetical protein